MAFFGLNNLLVVFLLKAQYFAGQMILKKVVFFEYAIDDELSQIKMLQQ